MKKLLLIGICLLLGLWLSSCKSEKPASPEQNAPAAGGGPSVVFSSEIEEADVWILPETKENLKTTVWGTPSLKKIGTGEKRRFFLTAPGESGLYIVRAIDKNGMYYAANSLVLEEECCLLLKKGSEPMSAVIEVTAKDGKTVKTYPVFAARL
ncbi:hypothetical protein IJT93_07095 [bacterium]|nr:hypothetical protein [bacterium]